MTKKKDQLDTSTALRDETIRIVAANIEENWGEIYDAMTDQMGMTPEGKLASYGVGGGFTIQRNKRGAFVSQSNFTCGVKHTFSKRGTEISAHPELDLNDGRESELDESAEGEAASVEPDDENEPGAPDEDITERDLPPAESEKPEKSKTKPSDPTEKQVAQAIEIIRETQRASSGTVQRKLKISFTKAARILDILEERGYIGPANGEGPRDIIALPEVEEAAAE